MYYSASECLYCDAFTVEKVRGVELSYYPPVSKGNSGKRVHRSSRWTTRTQSRKKDLAKQARRVEEVFAWNQAHLKTVRAVESPPITSIQFETLREKLNEVKSLLKVQGNAAADWLHAKRRMH